MIYYLTVLEHVVQLGLHIRELYININNIHQKQRKEHPALIFIDYKDRRPVYEQIADHYQELVITGVLEADTPLPSVRALAMELSINPNTIQHAYAEMERRGILYSVKGRGSFIAGTEPLVERRKRELMTELSVRFAEAARLGMDPTALQALLQRNFPGGVTSSKTAPQSGTMISDKEVQND